MKLKVILPGQSVSFWEQAVFLVITDNSLKELELDNWQSSAVAAQYLPSGQQYQSASLQHPPGHSVSSGSQVNLATDNSLYKVYVECGHSSGTFAQCFVSGQQ